MTYLENCLSDGTKYRADLLKWKAAAVGALGAVGLGFQKPDNAFSVWVLCLVPFLCAYIDLLYRDACIRRELIRVFLADAELSETDDDALLRQFVLYETNARKARFGLSLEAGAILWSSILVSILVLLAPNVLPRLDRVIDLELYHALRCAGGIGITLAVTVELIYWCKQPKPKSSGGNNTKGSDKGVSPE